MSCVLLTVLAISAARRGISPQELAHARWSQAGAMCGGEPTRMVMRKKHEHGKMKTCLMRCLTLVRKRPQTRHHAHKVRWVEAKQQARAGPR